MWLNFLDHILTAVMSYHSLKNIKIGDFCVATLILKMEGKTSILAYCDLLFQGR